MPRVPHKPHKVAVVGDPAVGKTAALQVLHSNGSVFPRQYLMTCGGCDLFVKTISPLAGVTVTLHLLDSPGHEVFGDLLPTYWKALEIDAIALVYDATRWHTYVAVTSWYQRLLEAVGCSSLPGVLIANKFDLRERLAVPRVQGEELAEKLQMPYFETSAKDGEGVDIPFTQLAEQLHQLDVGDISSPVNLRSGSSSVAPRRPTGRQASSGHSLMHQRTGEPVFRRSPGSVGDIPMSSSRSSRLVHGSCTSGADSRDAPPTFRRRLPSPQQAPAAG